MDRKDRNNFRFDYEEEIISYDEATGKYTAVLRPNPNRYEWRERDGKRELFDKFDHLIFPESLVFGMLEKALNSHPNPLQTQQIDDLVNYYKIRAAEVREFLKIRSIPVKICDKSEAFLESLSVDKLNFVVMSVDIIGSTELAISCKPEEYALAITVILHELSHLIPKFYGHVLKYTGDGLIAYFPEPSFITKNDLAVDCALTLRDLIYNTINPEFKLVSYPQVNIRIGLDAGEAYIPVIGSSETKQHKDIIGSVVSLAAKIQSVGRPGKVYIGGTVERHLHTTWRKFCKPVDLQTIPWQYRDSQGELYKIFEIDL